MNTHKTICTILRRAVSYIQDMYNLWSNYAVDRQSAYAS